MRFEQLHYLDAAIRFGSLRRAAIQLGVSQPTISSQIQRLEEELGVLLIVRATRGVSATDAGLKLLPQLHAALRAEADIRRVSDSIVGLASGCVSMGVTPAASQLVLPELVQEFRLDYPDIDFTVTESVSTDISRTVAAGDVDMGIVARFSADDVPGAFRHTDLATGRIVLCIPTHHPLAARDVVSVADLAGQPMIVFQRGSLLREAFDHLLGEVRMETAYEINSAESAQRLVRAGVGLALGHTLAPSTRSVPGVVLATLDFPWMETRLSAILRADRQPAPAVAEFYKRLRDRWSRDS